MKKFTMFSSVLASALMLTVASCSSEDVAGGDSQNGKGATSYLAVNIENVGSAPASRAYNQGMILMRMEPMRKVRLTRCVSTSLMVMVLHICWLIMMQHSKLL